MPQKPNSTGSIVSESDLVALVTGAGYVAVPECAQHRQGMALPGDRGRRHRDPADGRPERPRAR